MTLGWYAEEVPPMFKEEQKKWVPALQLDTGSYVTVACFFPSEPDCLQFIRENIIGKKMVEADQPDEEDGATVTVSPAVFDEMTRLRRKIDDLHNMGALDSEEARNIIERLTELSQQVQVVPEDRRD